MQAKANHNGRTVYRWHLDTTSGRRTTWAASRKEAQRKADKLGLKVIKIYPALPLGT